MYLDTSKDKRYSKKIVCVLRCTSGELSRGGLWRENNQEEGRLGRQRGKERREKGRVEVERDPER